MKKVILLVAIFIYFTSINQSQTVTDIDGNVYHTVKIGTQVWLIENLKVTKYRDGSSIPNVKENNDWSNLSTGAYCFFNNDEKNKNDYGLLYNYYAVNNSKNIAPVGYHVPTDSEWNVLISYLGGEKLASDKLRESGLIHWAKPNDKASNSSGFSALPGGHRKVDGVFQFIGYSTIWWTTTEESKSKIWSYIITNTDTKVTRYANKQGFGFSIRCIKD